MATYSPIAFAEFLTRQLQFEPLEKKNKPNNRKLCGQHENKPNTKRNQTNPKRWLANKKTKKKESKVASEPYNRNRFRNEVYNIYLCINIYMYICRGSDTYKGAITPTPLFPRPLKWHLSSEDDLPNLLNLQTVMAMSWWVFSVFSVRASMCVCVCMSLLVNYVNCILLRLSPYQTARQAHQSHQCQ